MLGCRTAGLQSFRWLPRGPAGWAENDAGLQSFLQASQQRTVADELCRAGVLKVARRVRELALAGALADSQGWEPWTPGR